MRRLVPALFQEAERNAELLVAEEERLKKKAEKRRMKKKVTLSVWHTGDGASLPLGRGGS